MQSVAQCLGDFLVIYVLRRFYEVSMLLLLCFIFQSVSAALLINCTILVCMGVKLGTKSRQCLDHLHSEEVL